VSQPRDQHARAAAIDPTRSFIVQAPAGSGKTELLTDRLLALLAVVNRPEEIVAITFTRKAAAEMQARVMEKLRAARGACPAEDYRRKSWELAQVALRRSESLGWDLLNNPARLSLHTFDALAAQLVRAMPWLSALGGMGAIANNPRHHYEQAALTTLGLADAVPSVATLIQHLDVNLSSATSMLADMLEKRDQWLDMLGQHDTFSVLEDNLSHMCARDLEGLAQQMPAGWADALHPVLTTAAQCLLEHDSQNALTIFANWDGAPFSTQIDGIPYWQALATLLLTRKPALRKTVNVNQGFPPGSKHKDDMVAWLKSVDAEAPWVASLANIARLPAVGYTAEQQENLRAFLEVLALANAQLLMQFSASGEMDFIEVARRAVLALGHSDAPTDLLLLLDNRISHILVDEFQDTNHSQIQLLMQLTSGWTPDEGRTLFLVGDPMQSIYRFRKAEVAWFLRVKQEGLGNIPLESLALTTNFRSQKALVEHVNTIFGRLFPREDDATLGAISYTPASPFNPARPGAPLVFHPIWRWESDTAPSKAQAYAQMDAKVVALAREALHTYRDASHPVVVLVQTRSQLNNVVSQMVREGVACRAVELVPLQQRQPVIDVMQLARALSHPADRVAWLSVLRSPLCGLTLHALHALFGHDHQSTVPELLRHWAHEIQENGDTAAHNPLSPEDTQRLMRALMVLLDDANAAGSLPFSAWVEQCWERLQGPAVYYHAHDRSDVEQLFRLIDELAPHGSLDITQLTQRLETLYAAPHSTMPAVEVMTMHRAKGLEFECVILMGLCRRSRPDTTPLIRTEQSEGRVLMGPVKRGDSEHHDPISDYLGMRESIRSAHELGRLLYVAITRARSELHLVASVRVTADGSPGDPAKSSLLARLWPALSIPPVPSQAPSSASLTPTLPTSQNDRASLLVRPVLTAPAATELLPKQEATTQPWSWMESQDERLTGVVAHAWLERIAREGLGQWSVEQVHQCKARFRWQLQRAGVLESGLDDAVEVLVDTLTGTLQSEQGRWLLQVAKAYREWSLLDLEGRVSVIDLAIDRQDDWLVVDFKTGVPAAGESVQAYTERMRQRYQAQLQRYCEHVHQFDGRAAQGVLYFPRIDLWVNCVQTC